MACKIDHNAPDCSIPLFLCRACNPDKFTASAVAPADAPAYVDPIEAEQRRIRARFAEIKKEKSRARIAKMKAKQAGADPDADLLGA